MIGYITIEEKDVTAKFKQLITILHNLRYCTKYWHENGGLESRKRKMVWEKQADELLTELGLKQHMHITSVYVARIDTQNT